MKPHLLILSLAVAVAALLRRTSETQKLVAMHEHCRDVEARNEILLEELDHQLTLSGGQLAPSWHTFASPRTAQG